MIIRSVASVAGAALVGAAAWLSIPQASFTSVVDAWEGLQDSATVANNAGRTFFPGAIGPGAVEPPQFDSIRNGDGEWKVIKVTEYNYGTINQSGTMRTALDSAAIWGAGNNNCTLIMFGGGGAVNTNFFDDPSGFVYDDDLNCVYFLGQTSQGGGLNMRRGGVLAEGSDHIYAGYFNTIKPGQNDGFIFDGGSRVSCGSGYYIEHLTNAWWNRDSGNNFVTVSCGTEGNPRVGEFVRNFTVNAVLGFEPHADHPTMLNISSAGPADGDTAKVADGLVYRTASLWGGQRAWQARGADSVQIIANVAESMRNYFGWVGQQTARYSAGHRIDFLDQYVGNADWTTYDSNSGWALYWTGSEADDTTTITIAGVRTDQNSFALDTPADSLLQGSQTSFACDADHANYGCTSDGDPLPISILSTDTLFLATKLGIPWAEPSIVPLTDSVADAVVQNAGNSRYVACDGTWTRRGVNGFFGDSVAARAKGQWLSGDGPGNSTTWVDELQTDLTRTYGQPATGTACTDADGDNLPDDWELDHYGNLTSVTATDTVLGVWPAAMMYAFGRNPGGGLVGCNGTCSAEENAIFPTFGNVARFVYFVPAETQFGLSLPALDPLSSLRFSAWNPAGDTAMAVSCDQLGAPADSATVDARLSAWSIPSFSNAADVRDFDPFPAIEC